MITYPVALLNPKVGETPEDIPTFITDQSVLDTVTLIVRFTGTGKVMQVDWGDGSAIEDLLHNILKSHAYSSTGEYEIKIIEDTALYADVTNFNFYASRLTGHADCSKFVNAVGIDLEDNRLTSFDITGLNSIKTLDLRGANASNLQFTGTLDLRGFTSLTTLYVDYCNFTSIILDDLTNLTRYLEYTVAGNRGQPNLTSFSANGCSKLAVVNFIGQSSLATLDLTDCVALTGVRLTGTDLDDDALDTIDSDILLKLNLRSSGFTALPSNLSLAAKQNITTLYINGGSITSVDLTDYDSLINFGSATAGSSVAPLSSLTLPTVKTALTKMYLRYNELVGVLDVSAYSNLAQFEFEFADYLTEVDFSDTDVNLQESWRFRDMLVCTKVNAANSLETQWLLNDSQSSALVDIDISGTPCTSFLSTIPTFPVAMVNKILVDLDDNGYSDGTCVITGPSDAPDSSSGGYDGLTAITNLQGKGWTVTTN